MNTVLKHLPTLIRASLDGEKRTVELSTLSIIRKLKKEEPQLSSELAKILATYNAGAPMTRSMGIDPPPVDKDSFMSLVNISDQSEFDEIVVLNSALNNLISNFLKEREAIAKLIANDVKPPNSILFYGPPGVGKTLLSKYIAHKLRLPLISLDLSSAISSYLGSTGKNLKKVLEYGKSAPSVLLLDEFDAVAKRRDDPSDLGELKRIVNVLLKELEEWPYQSIIIAATNHPEFLDKAIWRRFDIKIEISYPDEGERIKLWDIYLNKKNVIKIDHLFLTTIAKSFEQLSPSDIKQISERVLRQVLVEDVDPIENLISQLKELGKQDSTLFNKIMVKNLKEVYKTKISQAKIAKMLGISPSTVSHHLKGK
ncbi:AAA family ATPase [Sporolactobacillus shoreicorticis]|uniref:AAA family ATPase n=1 Tax=Sporolactobacillus shoreicorticis TaxID=1923877 RepID=A0ABW5S8H8_9BACL|nr:ATP-binding protein [Sporolactobacillus shoreicorticis]MCO7126139.1 AAA family ATPase [Sporolactobacillus shoreicorticis]